MMVLGLSKFCQHNFKHTTLATGSIFEQNRVVF